MRGAGWPGLIGLAMLGAVSVGNGASFGLDDVIARAEALSKQPYHPPAEIPKFMQDLSFIDYQNVRFNPDKSLWSENHSKFQVMFVAPGLYYTHAVAINVVDASGVTPIPFRKTDFTFSNPELEKRIPADLGLAGFKLTYPFNRPDEKNQFLVFAGASYFRGVGRRNAFGVSARGIAVDTGLPSGEKFPSFVEFWLVRPPPDADEMTIYGLLDGTSVTGAYRFTVRPGDRTAIRVRAVLFARTDIEQLGIAPLTSMFYYGDNTGRPVGEWRRQVHDSDGLLVHDASSGEWLWRPLINPKTLQSDAFHCERLGGFGLLQRSKGFADYQDLAARYELRPSAWVQPQNDWGPGEVMLVALPTPNETHDNIVAFWHPAGRVKAGGRLDLEYRLDFGDGNLGDEPTGQSLYTFVGDGNRPGGGTAPGSYRILVDFNGGMFERLSPRSAVVSRVTGLDGTEVLEHFVEYNEVLHTWRLSILAKPAASQSLALRGFLSKGEDALTETWTYRLPPENDVSGKQ
jgi:glucans biosynthesis protein